MIKLLTAQDLLAYNLPFYERIFGFHRPVDEQAMAKAEEDSKLFNERIVNRLNRLGGTERPIVGDVLILADGSTARIAHCWDDGAQPTSGNGSFYIYASGFMSHSGGLEPSIPYDKFEREPGLEPAMCWLFSGDRSGAGRGVSAMVPVRKWKVKA